MMRLDLKQVTGGQCVPQCVDNECSCKSDGGSTASRPEALLAPCSNGLSLEGARSLSTDKALSDCTARVPDICRSAVAPPDLPDDIEPMETNDDVSGTNNEASHHCAAVCIGTSAGGGGGATALKMASHASEMHSYARGSASVHTLAAATVSTDQPLEHRDESVYPFKNPRQLAYFCSPNKLSMPAVISRHHARQAATVVMSISRYMKHFFNQSQLPPLPLLSDRIKAEPRLTRDAAVRGSYSRASLAAEASSARSRRTVFLAKKSAFVAVPLDPAVAAPAVSTVQATAVAVPAADAVASSGRPRRKVRMQYRFEKAHNEWELEGPPSSHSEGEDISTSKVTAVCASVTGRAASATTACVPKRLYSLLNGNGGLKTVTLKRVSTTSPAGAKITGSVGQGTLPPLFRTIRAADNQVVTVAGTAKLASSSAKPKPAGKVMSTPAQEFATSEPALKALTPKPTSAATTSPAQILETPEPTSNALAPPQSSSLSLISTTALLIRPTSVVTPKTTPKAATEPTPKSAAKLTPKAATEPTPKSAAKLTPKVATEPTPKVATEPTPKVATEPTPKAATEPTPKSAAKPTSKAATEPTPKSAAKPTPKAATEHAAKAATEPTSKALTLSQVTGKPKPAQVVGTPRVALSVTSPILARAMVSPMSDKSANACKAAQQVGAHASASRCIIDPDGGPGNELEGNGYKCLLVVYEKNAPAELLGKMKHVLAKRGNSLHLNPFARSSSSLSAAAPAGRAHVSTPVASDPSHRAPSVASSGRLLSGALSGPAFLMGRIGAPLANLFPVTPQIKRALECGKLNIAPDSAVTVGIDGNMRVIMPSASASASGSVSGSSCGIAAKSSAAKSVPHDSVGGRSAVCNAATGKLALAKMASDCVAAYSRGESDECGTRSSGDEEIWLPPPSKKGRLMNHPHNQLSRRSSSSSDKGREGECHGSMSGGSRGDAWWIGHSRQGRGRLVCGSWRGFVHDHSSLGKSSKLLTIGLQQREDADMLHQCDVTRRKVDAMFEALKVGQKTYFL